jgi:hypothetical protein
VNALQHMWGYVSEFAQLTAVAWQRPLALLAAIRTLTIKHQMRYLLESTALRELRVWSRDVEKGRSRSLTLVGEAQALGPESRASAVAAGSTWPRHAADAAPHAARRLPGR